MEVISADIKKQLFVRHFSWLEKGFYDCAKGSGWLKNSLKKRICLSKTTRVASKKASILFLLFFQQQGQGILV